MIKLSQLTLKEKITLLTGRDFWRAEDLNGKLPEIYFCDGPSGLRKCNPTEGEGAICATAMPTLSALATTWNTRLAYLDGETIADECVEKGVSVILAPGVNIKRTPLCGRNFEYFSEDPYFSGVMAKAFIEGVQSKGVGASLKHFACNNREYDREFQSSEVDERTLREIYFPAFEIALQAHPYTVMCAYNPINGVYCSENKRLLRDVLRGEFAYNGVIVSDWGAVHNSAKAVAASLDLRMAHDNSAYEQIEEGLANGTITERDIDECVGRIITLAEKVCGEKRKVTFSAEQRHNRAVEIAKESLVLLKNEGVLPIKKGVKKVAVFGEFAQNPPVGGGGSSFVNTAYKQKNIAEYLKESGECEVYYRSVFTQNFIFGKKMIAEHGSDADLVILCVGEDKTTVAEGFDRQTLKLSSLQEDMIISAAAINPNIAVVLFGGGAIDTSAWIDKVKAVIFAGFAGEGVNEALAAVIKGEISPSGKLTETFPLRVEDTPTGLAAGNGYYERYEEGIFVGYRYYDEKKLPVAFPFGFGLSYAKFEYSDLKITRLGDTDFTVSYSIKNVSETDAQEVSQVYVSDTVSSVSRPEKELKGFSKDLIKAGEKKMIGIKLDFRSFAFYSLPLKRWFVENGKFKISVGGSSRDIFLQQIIEIKLPQKEQYSYQR